MRKGPMKVPDVIAKIKGGGQEGVETTLQVFSLLLGRHLIGDEEALKGNSDNPVSMDSQIF